MARSARLAKYGKERSIWIANECGWLRARRITHGCERVDVDASIYLHTCCGNRLEPFQITNIIYTRSKKFDTRVDVR